MNESRIIEMIISRSASHLNSQIKLGSHTVRGKLANAKQIECLDILRQIEKEFKISILEINKTKE